MASMNKNAPTSAAVDVDDFELDVKKIKEQCAQPALRAGTYLFLAKGWKRTTDEATGHRRIQFKLHPLKNHQDASSASFLSVFSQLDMPDGKFPNGANSETYWLHKTYAMTCALFEHLPQIPVKAANGKYYTGTVEVPKKEFQEYKEKAHVAAAQFLREMWKKGDAGLAEYNSPTGALVVTCTLEDYEYQDKKTGETKSGRGLKRPCATPPPNTKYVPAEMFVDDGTELPE